jgi:hypothetical protein
MCKGVDFVLIPLPLLLYGAPLSSLGVCERIRFDGLVGANPWFLSFWHQEMMVVIGD